MQGYRDMPIEEMVRIEDKEILQTAPFRPAATKYPEPYLRVLQNLSLKWQTRNGLRTLPENFAVQYSSFQKAYHMKTKATAS